MIFKNSYLFVALCFIRYAVTPPKYEYPCTRKTKQALSDLIARVKNSKKLLLIDELIAAVLTLRQQSIHPLSQKHIRICCEKIWLENPKVLCKSQTRRLYDCLRDDKYDFFRRYLDVEKDIDHRIKNICIKKTHNISQETGSQTVISPKRILIPSPLLPTVLPESISPPIISPTIISLPIILRPRVLLQSPLLPTVLPESISPPIIFPANLSFHRVLLPSPLLPTVLPERLSPSPVEEYNKMPLNDVGDELSLENSNVVADDPDTMKELLEFYEKNREVLSGLIEEELPIQNFL